MARRRKPGTPTKDYGPDILRRPIFGPTAGKPAHLLRDSLVEVDTDGRADPTNPALTVIGARRRDGLHVMWKRGNLTYPQWLAADRFRDDWALAGGARIDTPDQAGVRVSGNPALMGPGDNQMNASVRVRGAWAAAGEAAHGVVSWVVVGNGTIDDYAEACAVGKERVRDLLKDALDRMADFYTNYERRGRVRAVQEGQK